MTLAGRISGTINACAVSHDIIDLYRARFDPVVREDELMRYHTGEIPSELVELVASLQRATDLVFVFPVWNYSFPALLKGYFDRVWRPRVSFELTSSGIRPLLANIKSLTVIATHGQSQAYCGASGDGTVEFFGQSLPNILPSLLHNQRFDFYDLDQSDPLRIQRSMDAIDGFFQRQMSGRSDDGP